MVEEGMRYRKGTVHATPWRSHTWEQVDGSCCRHFGSYRWKRRRACEQEAVANWTAIKRVALVTNAVAVAMAMAIVIVLVWSVKLALVGKTRGNAAADCVAGVWLRCAEQSGACGISPIANRTAAWILDSYWTSKGKGKALLGRRLKRIVCLCGCCCCCKGCWSSCKRW